MFRSQVTLILRGVVLIATLMLCLQGVALVLHQMLVSRNISNCRASLVANVPADEFNVANRGRQEPG
jgi:hypothetical protein